MALDGYNQILPYISQGKTVAFVGSSGVGKSTLINRLLGEERLATNGLRSDDKGRHTTTHRALLVANEATRNHPIEKIGQVLRGYMKDMKRIAVGG